MDLDNDGTVTLDEMKRFMTQIGNNPLSEEEWPESAPLRPTNFGVFHRSQDQFRFFKQCHVVFPFAL